MARIGARIASSRESRGLTQLALASASGIERSALAKIERGHRGISALELAAVAQALDVRLEWFLTDGPTSLASHRAREIDAADMSTIDKALERIARDVEFVNSLDPDLLRQLAAPMPVPETAAAAEELAGLARTTCGLDSRSPVLPLVDVAARAGLLAFSMPLGRDTADAAATLLERGGVALVNSTNPVGRRRLALAHELGHHLIADDYTIDWRVAEQRGPHRVESLLDRFARAFLAPGPGVRAWWEEARPSDDLRTAAILAASHFRLDMSTLARRLGDLLLVDADEQAAIRSFRTTKSDIIEHGLIVPLDLEGVSLPRAFERAVLALYRGERISTDRALSLLGGTLEPEDLPPLRERREDEIWSVLS